MENKTFFKNVRENRMSLRDIFSDVGRKHTKEEAAQVFISGTELTTPAEEEMLAGWKKPFLFARFFGWGVVFGILLYVIWWVFQLYAGLYTLMFIIPCLVPMTCLLLVWEMNIPRNISLLEIFRMMLIGGAISIITTGLLAMVLGSTTSVWAALLEEPAKLIAVYLILRRKNCKYMLNGTLIGFAVGAGFAIIESIQYTLVTYSEYVIYFTQKSSDMGEVKILFYAGIGGLCVALLRAFVAIPGHGGYAALYGGALVKAKGEDEVQVTDLFQPVFLKYFLISVGLHVLHNYIAGRESFLGLPAIKLFPKYTNYSVPPEILAVCIVGIAIFLPFLKKGVNEVIDICMAKNNGRLTQAVMRGGSGIGGSSGASLSGIAGELAGQTYTVSKGRTTVIGRSAGAEGISLPNSRIISGRHCRMNWNNGSLYIMDLGSTNGTWLGNQRLTPHQSYQVTDGSVVYLGNKNCGFSVKL